MTEAQETDAMCLHQSKRILTMDFHPF